HPAKPPAAGLPRRHLPPGPPPDRPAAGSRGVDGVLRRHRGEYGGADVGAQKGAGRHGGTGAGRRGGVMRRLAALGPAGRILAGILAVTWIAAGTAAFVLGVFRHFW